MALVTSQQLRGKAIVAITGASGIRYGVRLASVLKDKGLLEAVLATGSADRVARAEEGVGIANLLPGVRIYWDSELEAPYASSSRAVDAVVVAPCSMRTLAAIAHGLGDNLVTRAVLAHLRLRRTVVLVLRETPLSLADIENMRSAALMGAVILPAAPAFYHNPKTVDDMVDFVVGKVLDVLGVEHNLYKRWRS